MDVTKLTALMKRVNEVAKETKTLYDVSEAEMLIVTRILVDASGYGVSPKLMARLMRAAAHFLDATDEVAESLFKDGK